jgi:hypothetical protein
MWEDYDFPGGTLRENLYGVEGQKYLRDDHYGHKFRYGSDFEGDTMAKESDREDIKVEGASVDKHGLKNGVEVPTTNGYSVPEKDLVAKSE